MLGDKELAFEHLVAAAGNGVTAGGDLVEIAPQLAILAGDPRVAEIEAIMLATTNRDRAVVGLPPFNANYEVAP